MRFLFKHSIVNHFRIFLIPTIYFLAVSFSIYIKIVLIEGNKLDHSILLAYGVIGILCFLPPIILHVNYLLNNSCTKFEIDFPNGKYIFHKSDNIKEIRFEDVIYVHLVRIPYFKDTHFNLLKTPWPTPWSRYGYIKIKTKNGTYYITSLIINITNPPIPEYVNKYWLFPIICNKIKKNASANL